MSGVSPQFSKYRLIAELGRGGMATVYLAMSESNNHLDFSKLVVIKRLREHVAADPDFVVMLQDEGRLAARLNHQNVIQTHEVGEFDDEIFLAMEFLDGQPLHRIQRRAGATFPFDMQLTILSDVLAGVHYAHELRDFDDTPLNIVHRDVTPHNIFVTYEGQVKVLDFGIAKAEGRTARTKHGVVKGKLAYMAPEQARGLMIDRRTDIFSVGVMLFEAATGQRMWDKMSESDILRALVKGTFSTSPQERRASVDSKLDAICRKALAPDPADRFATADDFQAELEEYLHEQAPRVRPRRIGTWLSDLFADQRALTRETIEGQLQHIRARPSAHQIVKIDNRFARGGEDIDVDVDDDEDDSGISSNETRLVSATASLVVPTQQLEPAESSSGAAAGEDGTTAATVDGGRGRRLLLLTLVALAALVVAIVAALMSGRHASGEVTPPSRPASSANL